MNVEAQISHALWPTSLVLSFALAACVPNIDEGQFGCESNADCPEDWFCWSDGRCHSTAELIGADAGAPDANTPVDGNVADTGTRDLGPRDQGVGLDAARPDTQVLTDAAVDAGPDGGLSPDAEVGSDATVGTDAGPPGCNCIAPPQPFTLGMLSASNGPCPIGFEGGETPLYADLDPGAGCVGSCSCQPNPTECLAEIYIYSNENQCLADLALTGGSRYGDFITSECTNEPVSGGFAGGYRLGGWTISQSCAAAGNAAPSPYQWGEQSKFCAASSSGPSMCANGEFCLDAMVEARSCLITAGGSACPAPYTERVTRWFTGLSDTRSCGACGCTASGGSCEYAQVALGSDWVCTDDVYLSQQDPVSCGSAYSPPARVTGWPTDPTCTAASPLSGSIQATGQQTLCCRP